MAIWVSFLLYGDVLSQLGYFSAQDWHIHEMLFGFLPAAIAGFLLTAVPNWTGRLPVRGTPLALLAGTWLTGRLAILISGLLPEHLYGTIAVIDSLFLVSFAGLLLAREIIAGKNTKNLPVVAIVGALAASNIAFHMATLEMIADCFNPPDCPSGHLSGRHAGHLDWRPRGAKLYPQLDGPQ